MLNPSCHASQWCNIKILNIYIYIYIFTRSLGFHIFCVYTSIYIGYKEMENVMCIVHVYMLWYTHDEAREEELFHYLLVV
jgi:hypothetical protein